VLKYLYEKLALHFWQVEAKPVPNLRFFCVYKIPRNPCIYRALADCPMSLKLSKNRVNFLTKLIVDSIQNSDDIDYTDDLGNIRFKIYHLILAELKMFEDIETLAREKIISQKKNIPDGSREWEILFRKYTGEELNKLGRVWD